MHGEIDIAIRSDASQLLCNVVDHGLATVVELGLAKVPGLVISKHGIQLVYGGNEGELGVFENFSVSVSRHVSELINKSIYIWFHLPSR